jgi:hypothetical protein
MVVATTPQGRKQRIVERMGKGADSRSSLMAVLSASEDRTELLRIIGPCEWELQWIGTCEEAIEVFHRTSPAIVICDSQLADGDWRQLWGILAREPKPPYGAIHSAGPNRRSPSPLSMPRSFHSPAVERIDPYGQHGD